MKRNLLLQNFEDRSSPAFGQWLMVSQTRSLSMQDLRLSSVQRNPSLENKYVSAIKQILQKLQIPYYFSFSSMPILKRLPASILLGIFICSDDHFEAILICSPWICCIFERDKIWLGKYDTIVTNAGWRLFARYLFLKVQLKLY